MAGHDAIDSVRSVSSAVHDTASAFRSEYFHSAIAPSRGGDALPPAPAVVDSPAPAGVSPAAWSQVSDWVQSNVPVNFVTAGAGAAPDYFLSSDGNLRANPAKSPNADGSVTVQVENANAEAASKAARDLQVAAVQQKIAYWQAANPGKDVPHFLKSMLHGAQNHKPEVAAPNNRAQPTPIQDSVPQSIGNKGIGSAPGTGYKPGSFEPNGPIDRTAIPKPVPGDMAIKGPPSANPEQIQQFLEKMGSPAAREAGFSQALYDACTNRGIDPAVAVGFFLQESTCGRYGRGHENKSLGNIKGVSPESGMSDGTFRRYATWAEGARDWARLIDESYVQKRGLQTLSQVVSVYAPSSDGNNERGYVSLVKGVVENFKKQNNGTTATA